MYSHQIDAYIRYFIYYVSQAHYETFFAENKASSHRFYELVSNFNYSTTYALYIKSILSYALSIQTEWKNMWLHISNCIERLIS